MKKLFLNVLIVIGLVSCGASQNTNTEKESVSIQLVRNATLKLDYNGKTFMIDPSLSPKHSFMSFVVPNENLNPTVDLPMVAEEVVKGVDAILVSHTHLDHFDEGAKQYLNNQLPLFGQPFDKKVLEESPFTNITLVKDKEVYEGTTIIRTKGKHGPDHMLQALGEVSGFVLQAPKHPTIYVVGDCLLDENVKSVVAQYNPDIIVVNSGGAEFGGEVILMDDKRAVELAVLAPKSRVVAVHMEALDHCKTTRQMVREEAKKKNVTMLVPNDGEVLTF